jgi:hypothetical protein
MPKRNIAPKAKALHVFITAEQFRGAAFLAHRIPDVAYCVVPGSSICSCTPAFEA